MPRYPHTATVTISVGDKEIDIPVEIRSPTYAVIEEFWDEEIENAVRDLALEENAAREVDLKS